MAPINPNNTVTAQERLSNSLGVEQEGAWVGMCVENGQAHAAPRMHGSQQAHRGWRLPDRSPPPAFTAGAHRMSHPSLRTCWEQARPFLHMFKATLCVWKSILRGKPSDSGAQQRQATTRSISRSRLPAQVGTHSAKMAPSRCGNRIRAPLCRSLAQDGWRAPPKLAAGVHTRREDRASWNSPSMPSHAIVQVPQSTKLNEFSCEPHHHVGHSRGAGRRAPARSVRCRPRRRRARPAGPLELWPLPSPGWVGSG
jgi:hypothetical protein